MATECLEERVPWGDPLQLVLVSHLTVGRQARITSRQWCTRPIWLALIPSQDGGRARWFKRVQEGGDRLQSHRHVRRCLLQEARDGLWHQPTLLRTRPPLDEHLQIERLGSQPLKRIFADGPKV